MAIINHSKREINAKIVYHGPEGVGKGTSLRYLYERVKPSLRSEFKSQQAHGGLLLFFDFFPFEYPVLGGYRLRFHIYTLAGRIMNPAAWKMTLKGADGLVLVTDAASDSPAEGQQTIAQLRDYLSSYGRSLSDIPTVLQVNKADQSREKTPETAAALLDLGDIPACLTTAVSGEGVLETVSLLSRQVMSRLSQDIARRSEQEKDFSSSMDEGTAERDGAPNHVTDADITVDVERSAGDDCLRVVLNSNAVSYGEGILKIPMAVSLMGQTRRFSVNVTVQPEDICHDDY